MKTFFITGTDTDCGKTYTTCQLLQYLNQEHRAQALKPVASGVMSAQSGDVHQLQQYNIKPLQPINRWSFKEPIAPHIAASNNNQHITSQEVAQFCSQAEFAEYDYLLIEGAGGLMVPLNNTETWLDFLDLYPAIVLLVVGIRVGCINHALLSDAVLHNKNISYAGWIANFIQPETLEDSKIIDFLTEKMHKPLITTIPYYGKINQLNSIL